MSSCGLSLADFLNPEIDSIMGVIILEEKSESKVNWITCPECGSKIGIVVSVGQARAERTFEEPRTTWPSTGIRERLASAGVDLALIDIEEGEESYIVRPKRFLGDLWGPVNDGVRSLGGIWIREGRDSRWEISKEETS